EIKRYHNTMARMKEFTQFRIRCDIKEQVVRPFPFPYTLRQRAKTYGRLRARYGHIRKVSQLHIQPGRCRPSPFIIEISQSQFVKPEFTTNVRSVICAIACRRSLERISYTDHIVAYLRYIRRTHNRDAVVAIHIFKRYIQWPGLPRPSCLFTCQLRLLDQLYTNIHTILLWPDQVRR